MRFRVTKEEINAVLLSTHYLVVEDRKAVVDILFGDEEEIHLIGLPIKDNDIQKNNSIQKDKK